MNNLAEAQTGHQPRSGPERSPSISRKLCIVKHLHRVILLTLKASGQLEKHLLDLLSQCCQLAVHTLLVHCCESWAALCESCLVQDKPSRNTQAGTQRCALKLL